MATAAPAAASSAPSSPPSSGGGSESTSPVGPGPSPALSSRPTFESEGQFFGTEAPADPADPTDPDAPADPDAPPADPGALLESLLASADPTQRAALQQHLRELKSAAGRAPAAQKSSDANYQSAQAHAAIAAEAIARLRGAGIDVSDLADGAPKPAAPAATPESSDFDVTAAETAALGMLSPAWNDALLDAQDQADELSQSAAEFAAAGDQVRAASLKKQARALRAKVNQGLSHSAVKAAALVAGKAHGHLYSRLSDLSGKFDASGTESATNQMAVDALSAAAAEVDEASGQRVWVERGLIHPTKNAYGPIGAEVYPLMVEWAVTKGLDIRDSEVMNDAFWATLGRTGKLKRNATKTPTTATPTAGDPTSALVAAGAPSQAVPRRQPTSARLSETPDEIAARKNRSAFV